MDPEGSFPGALFRTWEPRMAPPPAVAAAAIHPSSGASSSSVAAAAAAAAPRIDPPPRAFEFGFASVRRESKTLDELFKDYGVRMSTLSKMTELGFTVQTLVNMTDQELEDVIKTMLESYHVELLVGEKYGIKSAIRAERKLIDDELERQRSKTQQQQQPKRRKPDEVVPSTTGTATTTAAVVSTIRDGSLKEPRRDSGSLAEIAPKEPNLVGQSSQVVVASSMPVESNGNGSDGERKRKKKQKRRRSKDDGEDGEDRPREHPFIVTEPGELARGKKNGLDYLFDLYEQCGKYLEEVQQQCKERGEKCPTKVTNQVFRHAKHRGASYINKPKMRHYVHCYALHCLDLEQSNHLRKLFKDRGENVGAWRQACYFPLVEMARSFNWDIEGVFSRNEKLRIWYVPTRLRQLCHLEKSKQG